MRWLSALVLFAPALAAAQPGATEPVPPAADPIGARGTEWLARGAHDAAVRGDCKTAYEIGMRVLKIDPAYHRSVIATDTVITSCVYVPPPAPPALPPREEPTYRMELPAGSPEISGGRLVGEFFLGGLLSLGGGVGGALLGFVIAGDHPGGCEDYDGGSCDDWDGLGGALIGGVVGLAVGASAGVALAGHDDDENYSFAATLGGATLGGVIGVALAANSDGEDFILPMIAAPTIGAMMGFNLSRSFKPRAVPVRATYPVTQRELVPPAPRLGGDRANIISLGTFAF